MKVVLQIDGGIGKNIMATTLCKKIKQTYPDAELIVLTAYPPIFLCNVSVDRVLGPADLNYFYDIVSGNHAVKFFLRDPTKETDYISGNKHLLQVWFEMYGFDYKGEMPEVILSAAEINFYRSKLVSNKPLLAIQSNSGSGKVLGNYRWYRDLPSHTIKQVIDALSTHYTIVHIKREDQPAFPNTIPFQSDFRSICALLSIADRRLLINSFAQHAAAALNLPSTVCWIGQSPSILGYSMHDNILARQLEGTFDDRDAFTDKYASQTYANKVSPTPYDREENIFDIHELLDSLSGERIGKLKSFAKIQANKQIAEILPSSTGEAAWLHRVW